MNELALQDLAFLYVADELEPSERAEVEERLAAGDLELQASLDEAAELLGMLPLALEAKQPRAEIEEALIARAERAPGTAAPAVSPNPTSTPMPTSPGAPRTRGNETTKDGENAGRVIPLRWVGGGLLGLAASLALMLGGAWIASQRITSDVAPNESADSFEAAFRAAELRNAELTRSLADLRLSESEIRERLSTSEADRRNAEAALQALQQAEPVDSQNGSVAAELAAAADANAAEIEQLKSQIGRLESELSGALAQSARSRALLEEARDDEAQIASIGKDLNEAKRALDLVRAPDVGIVDLFPTREDAPGSASVFWDAGLRDCYLHANGLQGLDGNQRYALWIEFEGGRVARVSDFQADARGDAEFFAALPQGKGEISRTFVTIESESNRVAPSGPVILEELASAATGDGAGKSRRRYRRRTL